MEEELEAWEALDVDDSDLSSFLRPCKRHDSTSHHSPPNPSSPKQTLNHSQQPPPHLIPGPAGEVQAAMMQHRALSDRRSSVLPTQEFIRRVIENGSAESDRDFKANAWLAALEFVRRRGIVDGDCVANESVTRLSSIKKHRNFGIVPQVVAVIKSCTPNGFGDMMVILKDPTTTIGATLHHKVFSEGQFRKDITVGSVLVLNKVAVFSPTPSACYLNITLRNIVKESYVCNSVLQTGKMKTEFVWISSNLDEVFSKDTGSPSEQVYPTHPVRRPASSIERNEKSWKELTPLLGNMVSPPRERTEGIMTSLRLHSRSTEVAGSDKQNEENLVPTSLQSDNANDRNQRFVLDRGNLSQRRDNATPVEITCGGVLESEMKDQPNPPKLGEGDNLACSVQGNISSTNSVHTSDSQETGINNHLEKQEIVNPNNSIPHWTDEQLDELLAFD